MKYDTIRCNSFHSRIIRNKSNTIRGKLRINLSKSSVYHPKRTKHLGKALDTSLLRKRINPSENNRLLSRHFSFNNHFVPRIIIDYNAYNRKREFFLPDRNPETSLDPIILDIIIPRNSNWGTL